MGFEFDFFYMHLFSQLNPFRKSVYGKTPRMVLFMEIGTTKYFPVKADRKAFMLV